MKKLILIFIIGVGGWAGYEWLTDWMVTERIGSAVEAAIDDPRTRTTGQIRNDIYRAVQQEGIELEPSAIAIIIAASDRQSRVSSMVSGAGISTTTQQITARVTYERLVWGARRTREVTRTRFFVATATPPSGMINRVLDKARNLRDSSRNTP